MVIAVVRAFVQLIAIGYALNLVFDASNPIFIVLIVIIMISVGGYTSGQRGKGIPHALIVALISISVGALLTLGLLVALGIFRFTPRDIIPIGGMVIGNSMNVCSLVMARLRDEIKSQKGLIETALALGATPQQAIAPHLRRALHAGMMPVVDSTKTIGLVQLPGAMTGMILAGASPLQAVQLQIIVMYMLIGAAAYTGLAAAYLTYGQFFTTHHQLVEVT
jgi:putative ABC transport system permease protein